MANFTTNYGLHQWEPGDSFLRTDFNTDFEKIDTALGRAERSAEANAYNVYNLMLQNYYEGKYTGYKRALLFDGFVDESGIAEKSEALIHTGTQMVLTRTGQGDADAGYSSNSMMFYDGGASRTFSPTSAGRFTGWTVKLYSTYGGPTMINYTVYRNDIQVAAGTWQLEITDTAAPYTMSLSQSIPVTRGDSLKVTWKASSTSPRIVQASSGSEVGGVFHFTSLSGVEASLVAPEATLPACARILAWVRHSGCTVGLTLLDGDLEYPMELTGTAPARNLQNQACTESAFLLEALPDGDTVAVRVELELTDGSSSGILYDYGMILL